MLNGYIVKLLRDALRNNIAIEQFNHGNTEQSSEKALYLALRCTLKIDQLLYRPQTPNSQKARLMSKRAKMQATQAKLLKAVFEHSGKGQEAAQMQQANIAIPISYIVEALTVVFAAGIALVILATITAHLFDLFTDIDDLVYKTERTENRGLMLQLTEQPTTMEHTEHQDALRNAYLAFPKVGGRYWAK
mgnify:CR=1 FL=1